MEYKRLTKKNRRSDAIVNMLKSRYSNNIAIKRLAELEDKIENGTLVEMPCKVGDTVWYVIDRGEYSTLCSTTVCRICIDSSNRMVIYLNATVRKIYIGYAQDDNAFLTKAEAEKRLEELRSKNK